MTSSENSTLSNLSPSEKRTYAIVDNGSLKLRIMKKNTPNKPIEWWQWNSEKKEVPFCAHGKKMISLLIDDIKLSFNEYKFEINDFSKK